MVPALWLTLQHALLKLKIPYALLGIEIMSLAVNPVLRPQALIQILCPHPMRWLAGKRPEKKACKKAGSENPAKNSAKNSCVCANRQPSRNNQQILSRTAVRYFANIFPDKRETIQWGCFAEFFLPQRAASYQIALIRNFYSITPYRPRMGRWQTISDTE